MAEQANLFGGTDEAGVKHSEAEHRREGLRVFEKWWEAYPKKEAKIYAQKCFMRRWMAREIDESIVETTWVQREHGMIVGRDHERYQWTPQPSSWINQGREADALVDKSLDHIKDPYERQLIREARAYEAHQVRARRPD